MKFVDKNKTNLKKLIETSYLKEIQALVKLHPVPEVMLKEDGSPVTKLDLALSSYMEEEMKKHFSNFIFYSEENYSEWGFPMIALDPLDGTREYVDQISEWSLSLAHLIDDKFNGFGWVFNPMTGESYFDLASRPFEKKTRYRGEVSRSEWKKGLFTNKDSEEFYVEPVGSIAYKLGRLAAGKCDFVVSLQPKNIWDIAAGTLLCQQVGMKFYSQGKLVDKVQPRYEAPLIWCYDEILPQLEKLFH